MRSLSDLFRNFLQLGYVTDDIDAAASYLESAMGTGSCAAPAVEPWSPAGVARITRLGTDELTRPLEIPNTTAPSARAT